jgi:hypothetical protein
MKKFLPYLFFCAAITSCNAQHTLPYQSSKVTKELELNFEFTDKRGIETDKGIVYIVDDSLKVISAYDDSILLWKVDIIAECGKPNIGRPEIRYIKLDKDTINVVFGKHDFASVFTKNGKAQWLGAD